MKIRTQPKLSYLPMVLVGLMICTLLGVAGSSAEKAQASSLEFAPVEDVTFPIDCVDGSPLDEFTPTEVVSPGEITDYLICKASPMVDMPTVFVDPDTLLVLSRAEPDSIELSTIGEVFMFYGEHYDVDPRFLVAISGAETTFGNRSCRQYPYDPPLTDPEKVNHNSMNYFYDAGDQRTRCDISNFDSWAEGIQLATALIANDFLGNDYEISNNPMGIDSFAIKLQDYDRIHVYNCGGLRCYCGSACSYNQVGEFYGEQGGDLYTMNLTYDAVYPPSPESIVEELSGDNHTCARYDSGRVDCWENNGSGNDYGQLGKWQTPVGGFPAALNHVVGLVGPVLDMAVGANHTCVVASVDEGLNQENEEDIRTPVWCWGRNDHGQLGNATNINSSVIDNPEVTGIDGKQHPNPYPRAITEAELGTFLDTNGRIDYYSPQNVFAVAAGDAHTCVLFGIDNLYLFGGKVLCWGLNDQGQLGYGSPTSDVKSPIGKIWARVPGDSTTELTGVTKIWAFGNTTCAQLEDGTVLGWGEEPGQCGNNYIYGSVTDIYGFAMVGATVTLKGVVEGQPYEATGVVGTDGTYRIVDVPAGYEYNLSVARTRCWFDDNWSHRRIYLETGSTGQQVDFLGGYCVDPADLVKLRCMNGIDHSENTFCVTTVPSCHVRVHAIGWGKCPNYSPYLAARIECSGQNCAQAINYNLEVNGRYSYTEFMRPPWPGFVGHWNMWMESGVSGSSNHTAWIKLKTYLGQTSDSVFVPIQGTQTFLGSWEPSSPPGYITVGGGMGASDSCVGMSFYDGWSEYDMYIDAWIDGCTEQPPEDCWTKQISEYQSNEPHNSLVNMPSPFLSLSMPLLGKIASLQQAVLDLQTYYSVRDLLAQTNLGDEYIRHYYEYGPELISIGSQVPSIQQDAQALLSHWEPKFNALVNGTGSSVTITQAEIDDLNAFLNEIDAHAGQDLHGAIAVERSRLNLQQFAGITMDQARSAFQVLSPNSPAITLTPTTTPTITNTRTPSNTRTPTYTSTNTPPPTFTPRNTPPGAWNVALNKPATASSECDPDQNSQLAVDGSPNTKWCAFGGGAPRWWQVDLGGVYSLYQFVIYHAQAGGEPSYVNTRDFNIQVSIDGINWTTVVDVYGNTEGVTYHNIADTDARYIRINVLVGVSWSEDIARINEFEAYGTGGPTSTPTPSDTSVPTETFTPTRTLTPTPSTTPSPTRTLTPTITPTPTLLPPGDGLGLAGEYFNNLNASGAPVVSRIDPQVDFGWAYDSPVPGIIDNDFSARWTGQVQARSSEDYVFWFLADDAIRVWVDGQLLVDDWSAPTLDWHGTGPIALTAGQQYPVRIEFYDSGGGAAVTFYWNTLSSDIPFERVPMEQLYLPPGGLPATVTPTASATSTNTFTPTLTPRNPPPGSRNVALNQPVTASGDCDDLSAPSAVDGSLITKWCDNSMGPEKWLQVDLGGVYSIYQFVIYHAEAGGEDPSYNTRDFSIRVSTNGADWTTVVNVIGNTLDVTTHNIPDVDARYIQLNITAAVQSDEDVARIYEFQAFGTGGPTATPTPTASPTRSRTLTPSWTFTRTPTRTFTPSASPTSSRTPTRSYTPTRSASPTNTRPTSTPTKTPTITRTPTRSYTPTRTFTPTNTRPTSTPTKSATITRTPTRSYTPTRTFTPTNTRPSSTPTKTQTISRTPTRSYTPTRSPTRTNTGPTPTRTRTPTRTPTRTRTP